MRFEIRQYTRNGRKYFVSSVSYLVDRSAWEERAVCDFLVTKAFGALTELMSALEEIYASIMEVKNPRTEILASEIHGLNIAEGYSMWHCGSLIVIHDAANGLESDNIDPDCNQIELKDLFQMSLEEKGVKGVACR